MKSNQKNINNLSKESNELYDFAIKKIGKFSLDIIKSEESLDLLDSYCFEENEYPQYINYN